MLALLLLLTAGGLGLATAASLRIGLGPWTRVGIGLAVGHVLLLWIPLLFGAAGDLDAQTAGRMAVAAQSAACLFWLVARRKSIAAQTHRLRAQLTGELARGDNRPLLIVGGAFTVLFAWLYHTHYLLPRADGLHSAGVTWGDLPIHLGLATRFLHADGFGPLEHPMFLNGRLTYPFLPDYSVATLTALGYEAQGGSA